jgi:hypothetical protein
MKAISSSIILVSVLVLAPIGAAQATCGIGSSIWEGNNGPGAKLLASTTNFWTMKAISTTFNIAGCKEGDPLIGDSSNAKAHHFASANFDSLARDMARGSGEHLDAFATLMQVSQEDQPGFRSLAKQNFALLFPHDRVTVGELLITLDGLMVEGETPSGDVES